MIIQNAWKSSSNSGNKCFNQSVVFLGEGLGDVVDALLLQFAETDEDEDVAGHTDDTVEPEDPARGHRYPDLVEDDVHGQHGRPQHHGGQGDAQPLVLRTEDLSQRHPGDGTDAATVGEGKQHHAEHLGDPLVREVVVNLVEVLQEEEKTEDESRRGHDGQGKK